VPIVRTFAPIVAGIGTMKWRTFATYNVIGGIAWAGGVLLAGNLLGKSAPWLGEDKYLLPMVLVIVGLSLIPVAIEVLRHRRAERA
ncbi:MAG: rane-associated protein, partial [Actinomycetota bacterium]